MNLEETAKLLTIIRASYPNSFKDKDFDPEIMRIQEMMWQGIFANVTYNEMITAVQAWVATEKFPPSPAELNPIVKKAKNPEAFLSAEKAWLIVDKAVRKYGWNNQELAFKTFNPNIIRAIRNVGGWQKICQTNLGKDWDFLRNNFKSVYEEFEEEAQEQHLLPNSVLERLKGMAENEPKQLPEV